MAPGQAARTAFVFAGGGSLGAVQVGMLKALVRGRVIPDFVVGASVGAPNGAYFAAQPTEAGIQPNLERARETLRRTIRDATRAADVITRLRALFSKKETSAEPVDLTEATREVIALCSSELQRKGTLLRSELASDIPAVIGDRVQLQQVILNLLTNAADAMLGVDDRPRELLIQTALDIDDRVRVTVRDSGVGFDPPDAEKLFEAFYSTKPQGMGIGLSVSRSIVESHHGRIWAAPNDGPGATVSFTIPRSSESL